MGPHRPKRTDNKRPPFWKMSYGVPCEQGVVTANTMPLRDMEVPGLIPDVSEVELALKEAQQGRQPRSLGELPL